MTQEEKEKVMQTIKKYMHIDCLGNGAFKNVLDNNGLSYVEKELEEMVTDEVRKNR